MIFKKIIVFLVLNFLFFGTNFLHGEDVSNLTNIGNKFIVVIENLSEDAIKTGLTNKRLRTVTELKLRREGITIEDRDIKGLPIEDGIKKLLYTPFFYVNVHVVGVAFHARIQVAEWIELKRIPISQGCTAVIWSKGFTGSHGGDPEFIISGLNQIFDEFFNEYYKANPKKKER